MLHKGTVPLDAYNAAVADIVSLTESEAAERPYLNGFMNAWGQASNNPFTL